MQTLAIKRYNIRDTKQYYSDINNLAAKGMEVITYNAVREAEEISHIRRDYLDFLFNTIDFKPVTELDEELKVYTVEVEEIGVKEPSLVTFFTSRSRYVFRRYLWR